VPTDFTNPISTTSYRLVIAADGASWRITKSYRAHSGTHTVRHLRGTVGPGVPPDAVIDALVLGEHQTEADVTGDPTQTFASVVLSDLNGAYVVLASMARNAKSACDHGRPGFRPGCGVLRRQMAAAFEEAAEGCRTMAQAWIDTGFTTDDLPAWLRDAMADVAML
jgi:hypothetical protein